MENQADANDAQPNSWYYEQLWRVPFPLLALVTREPGWFNR